MRIIESGVAKADYKKLEWLMLVLFADEANDNNGLTVNYNIVKRD